MAEIQIGVIVDYQPREEYDPERRLTYQQESDNLYRMNEPLIALSHRLNQLEVQCPNDERKAMYAEAHKKFYDFWAEVEQAANHLVYTPAARGKRGRSPAR